MNRTITLMDEDILLVLKHIDGSLEAMLTAQREGLATLEQTGFWALISLRERLLKAASLVSPDTFTERGHALQQTIRKPAKSDGLEFLMPFSKEVH